MQLCITMISDNKTSKGGDTVGLLSLPKAAAR